MFAVLTQLLAKLKTASNSYTHRYLCKNRDLTLCFVSVAGNLKYTVIRSEALNVVDSVITKLQGRKDLTP